MAVVFNGTNIWDPTHGLQYCAGLVNGSNHVGMLIQLSFFNGQTISIVDFKFGNGKADFSANLLGGTFLFKAYSTTDNLLTLVENLTRLRSA